MQTTRHESESASQPEDERASEETTIKLLHTHIALLKSVPFIATNESKKKKRENEKKSDFSRAGKAGSHKAVVEVETSENSVYY